MEREGQYCTGIDSVCYTSLVSIVININLGAFSYSTMVNRKKGK